MTVRTGHLTRQLMPLAIQRDIVEYQFIDIAGEGDICFIEYGRPLKGGSCISQMAGSLGDRQIK